MKMTNFYRGKTCKEYSLASALYDTIEDNNWRGVQYMLLEKHADPNIIIDVGISPFHLAIGNVSEDFALKTTKLILQCGGNPNIQTEDGLTPLHIAAAWGRMEIIELLLHFGANYEIRDSDYQTALDYAGQHQNYEIARILYDTYRTNDCAELEETSNYNLVLDKIIVNTGEIEAEYEVDKDVNLSSNLTNTLRELPETSPIEYVRNWCNQHSKTMSNDIGKEDSDTEGKASSLVPFECEYVKTIKPIDTSNVTVRTRKPKSNIVEVIALDYKESVAFLSQKEKNVDISKSFCKYTGPRESGITSISSGSSINDSILTEEFEKWNLKDDNKDTSSDYFTCNETSEKIFEKNITSTSSFLSNAKNEHKYIDFNNLDINTDTSLSTITEVYEYTDKKEGITLLEKRLLKSSVSETDNELVSQSSKLSSLPVSFDYNPDILREELAKYGVSAGPITKTTKRVYLKKLYKLQKEDKSTPPVLANSTKKIYSKEIEKTLQNPRCIDDVAYKDLEEVIFKEFSNPNPSRKWKEGVKKFSFSYLLLDSRLTKNLPKRADNMPLEETWQTFLNSIFYVGKGKHARPYSHLNEAVTLWNDSTFTSSNKKLQHILDIWMADCGVVCLMVFQNVIPVEAYTREAAMISALTLGNIKNAQVGQFYGTSTTWTSNQKNMLGTLLLYKAMQIFLSEGEKQLRPKDIK